MFKFIVSCLFLSSTVFAAGKSLAEQESILEHKLATASDFHTLTQVSNELAKIKIEQSQIEFKKIPEMLGQNRSIVLSSVRENLTYRQIASSFVKDPGNSPLANTYKSCNFIGLCCVLLGFVVLLNRLKYRY